MEEKRKFIGVGIPGYRMEERMVLKSMICKATCRALCPWALKPSTNGRDVCLVWKELKK